MTWGARFRLLLGVLVVLVVVALATDHLNRARGLATSTSAQIVGQDVAVGTPYAGLVLDRLAAEGDEVAVGDPLFVVDSATLTYDLSLDAGRATPASTRVDADGHLVVEAAVAGTVRDVPVAAGEFVSAGAQLATIEQAGSRRVEADLTLTPEQYARLDRAATVTVTLPDTSELTGTVTDVRVTTTGDAAQTVLTVEVPALAAGAETGMTAAGTPVVASVHLRNDGVVTTASARVRAWLDGVLP
jgi:multidrug efflux pump subunit AcrA (membrane-fusion protein)